MPGLRQLKSSKPGMLACFIPEIDDFQALASESRLQLMTHDLFSDPRRSHLVAVAYCSDTRFVPRSSETSSHYPGLVFRNPNCKFDVPEDLKFLADA